ncbi:hypothetical protein L249_4778 [Ophiocordyceps polyrhachis-furcata BCC 54312]|uniref:RNA helicase n=1 Tax=Ophiocordyceps polyrhachis-furcata BCC 54312 TaxID=1330021 RepID=A0A367L2A3_9HYPO|nr:hypothetical protein L249_4778 [Ophiocordyceps polyrhachis-furcata BCC 54312]
MAGAKKKKKPAANPARGFATTSIASKPRPETEAKSSSAKDVDVSKAKSAAADGAPTPAITQPQKPSEPPLSAEDFERQLEESELQLLVEKHAPRAKRDAQRQRSRLETDRRLLRGQADTINIPKWLPQDLFDHVLDLIEAETRFSASSISSENAGSGKMPQEEDMIFRLWTLRQTLEAVGFPESRIEAVLQHIIDIAPHVSAATKDSIWGLDEALEWLARQCNPDELPSYETKNKPVIKDATTESHPVQTGRPDKDIQKANGNGRLGKKQPKKVTVTFDDDIEPEDLVPEYVATMSQLLLLSRGRVPDNTEQHQDQADDDSSLETAKLEAKLRKIEGDILFDKDVAEQLWKAERVVLEKQLAATRRHNQNAAREKPKTSPPAADVKPLEDDNVAAEAERMAAEILADNADDGFDGVVGLFESLPQNEVDAQTGKTQTVINSSGGTRVEIRDFGDWSGIQPRRILEEACRSRDVSVKIHYQNVSETSWASRHSIDIEWTKPQEPPTDSPVSEVEIVADQSRFALTMRSVATPDAKQSEAYVATTALFHIFSSNAREEKVALRLPPVWRDLWNEMNDAKRDRLAAKDRVAVKSLRSLVRQRHDQELEDGVILQGAFRGRATPKGGQDLNENGHDRKKQASAGVEEFKKIWADKSASPKFQVMLESRRQLPMWQFRPQVLDAVDKNQVVIVCGETGWYVKMMRRRSDGKSTQVPSFLLEHELSQGKPCKIYCTEPRRISAISLARRVSEELGENRGDLGTNRSLIGYSIRLEANTTRETRLVYATTGIVMRMLEGSNDLREVTHLVLDEVHERSIDSDFLLIVLKRLLTQRKDLKVVLMSATVDAEHFSGYLGGAPILKVPGRTFPVEVRYLEDAIEMTGYSPSGLPGDKMIDLDDDALEDETKGPKSDLSQSISAYSAKTRATLSQLDEYHIDFDLIVQLLSHIATDESLCGYSKAVLVFLPGIADIRTLNDMLLGDPRFARDWLVYPLHSSIATEDQESAFVVPPPGMRKIVLATNIAETGITIPDVTCVIDTGKHREMRFDERRQLSRLIDTFISRANAKQRRGRAGRVQNGLCFHMFTKHRHDSLMTDQQTPEMLRLSLQDLAIRVKICKMGGIEETLAGALDPPLAKNIRRAIDALVDVRALTPGEELTPLGRQLARLPLDVFLGKLILLGTVFKCLDMAITVAAILSSKSPFSAPFGQRAQADKARMAFRRADSDLLTVYNAYVAWKRVCRSNSGMGKEFQFCRKNFLSQQTLANIEDLKGQLLVSLADSGFLSLTEEERRALRGSRAAASGARGRREQAFVEVPQRVDVNSDNDLAAASVIASSFYPKLLVRDTPGTKGLRNVGNNQSISLHPSSVNRGHLDIKWLSYYHIMQSKSVYHAHETTAVEPFAIALLCGDVRCDMFSGVMVLDGNRARFALPDWKTMLVIKTLRTRLREMLVRSFRQPGKLITAQHQKWFDVWQRLFSLQDQQLQQQAQERSSSSSAASSVAMGKA